MALFGAPRRLPNIDPRLGAEMMRERPGFGAGFAPQQQPQQRRPGLGTRLLGEGWAGKVGALGALLQGDTGAVGEYHEGQRLPLLQQAQRETEFADWQRRKQWERANPEPANNDTINDYNFIAQTIGREAADQYLRNLGDPMVNMSLPGNRIYSGPRSGLGGALQGQLPTAPVGRLTPIEGGPTPQASGTFRP